MENDDPKNKNDIDHIDGNRQNNDLNNLEWVTRRENIIRGRGKMVKMIDCETDKVLNYFDSISEATRYLGKTKGTCICNACKGKSLTAHGFKWSYATNEEKLYLKDSKAPNICNFTMADLEEVNHFDIW